MENLDSSTNMAADDSVSTVLSLSLQPSPEIPPSSRGVDLCPSIWCFNPIKSSDQEPPVPALPPNLPDFNFTLLPSSSTLSKPSSSVLLDLFPVSSDFLSSSDKNDDQDFDNSANIGIITSMKLEISDDPTPHKTENHSHLTTNMEDQSSVSTVLSLSLRPPPGIKPPSREGKPGVDLCPSIWCFNSIKFDQVPTPQHNLQDFNFTLLPSSTLSKPTSVLPLFPVSSRTEDFLSDENDQDFNNSSKIGITPLMKRKRKELYDHKTENHSHLTKTSGVRVTKKQRVEGDGHWIKKRLSLSDVNDSSRLLLGKEDVRKYVLPLMDEERCAACQSREGLRVKIWDLDTLSEHELTLKQWKTGSFLLNSNWSIEFVKRRNLQEGDCIGLRWDIENLGFFFHKFNAHS